MQPPKHVHKFFRWFCDPKLADYIEGDLLEVYKKRFNKNGKRNADLRFILDVILLFRPGIIRSRNAHQQINSTGMFKSYFKIGWRNLVRNKSYAFINIAGLALSMTCGIFIFSIIRDNLSYDNFHKNPESIYRVVTELHRDVLGYQENVPSPLGVKFRSDYDYAETVARVYTETDAVITLRKDGELLKFKEPDGLSFSEPSFFDIFNFPLIQGDRLKFLAAPNTAVITQRIAKKYFGEKSPIGETFWLANKIPFTVTGVLKDLPANTDVRSEIYVSWSTIPSFDNWLAHETAGWGGIRDGMKCYLVLKPGISTTQVEEVMSAYVKIFRPTSKNVHHYKLQPLNDIHFNENYGGAMKKSNLWVLGIIGFFLVITACVNFINLATAQALQRSKEVGIRKVLGSHKGQLFRQFIFETGMITFFAIVASALLFYIASPYVNAYLKTNIHINLFTDPTLLLFILGLGLAVTVFAGYYPGVVLSAFQPVAALKGKLSAHNFGGFNTRRVLIVTQFAISQVLIIGMVVIMNQMRYAKKSDLGFSKEAIIMVRTGSDSTGRPSAALKNEISRMRGVESVSVCFEAPASEDNWNNSIRINNATEEVNFRTSIKAGDHDYVSTFGLELAAGRNLQPSDTVREMLVNETLVRKLGLNSPEEMLGQIIVANGGNMRAPVVGVVKDFHDKSFHEMINAVMITTAPDEYVHYAVKINMADASSILEAIEDKWLQLHPDQMFEYRFLDDSIAKFYDSEETTLKLIQTFSFLAIFIGCLGLYGLVSFMVSQKTKEVGIRKVLGGSTTQIAWIFGSEFARLIVIAFAIAAPIGWWVMNNWLKGYQFKIEINMWTFVLAIGCSIVVAAVTVSFKVANAALKNPVTALRSE
jgi:predicted permease